MPEAYETSLKLFHGHNWRGTLAVSLCSCEQPWNNKCRYFAIQTFIAENYSVTKWNSTILWDGNIFLYLFVKCANSKPSKTLWDSKSIEPTAQVTASLLNSDLCTARCFHIQQSCHTSCFEHFDLCKPMGHWVQMEAFEDCTAVHAVPSVVEAKGWEKAPPGH